MSGLSRQMRRRQERHVTKRGAVPLASKETITRRPGHLLMRISMGEAKLNWQATLEEIESAYKAVEATRDEIDRDQRGAKIASDDEFKIAMRDAIIHGIQRNEHMVTRDARKLATIAMWYMWLKRDAINADLSRRDKSWDSIAGLTMLIDKAPNDWYQFSWGIEFKEDVPLPELERINVWTSFTK